MIFRRKFLKTLGISFLVFLSLPYKLLYSGSKKILNPDLSDQQKDVMFNEGTERAFTSDLLKENRNGYYHCANCGAKLFASNSKFDSGTGWPSFDRAIDNSILFQIDYKIGYARNEIICSKCGSHLGHMFKDGPKNTTGERHCINSLALNFKPNKNE